MTKTETYLLKKKYRNNYIARLAWSTAMLVLIYMKVQGVLLYLVSAHIGLSLIWVAMVEFETRFMYMENLRFFRITLDAFLYTILIYMTGGVNSFLMLSYIIFIMLASLYSTNRFGIYAIIICVTFYDLMLFFTHINFLPHINILGEKGFGIIEINLWTVLLTNFVLIFVSVIMNAASHTLYRKLMDKTDELEIERNRLRGRNEIIEKDLKLARKIQEQLIPGDSPHPSIFAMYKPMDEVGGDLYDFFNFRDPSKIGIFLSDVSGHGVPAAFITSMVKTMILQSGARREDPASLLMYLNNLLHGKTAENFITAFYGIYNKSSREIIFSNAGHNPPFILTESNIEEVNEGRSMPLAIEGNEFLLDAGMEYVNCVRTLQKNDRIIFYTDGLVEETATDGTTLFEDTLIEKILPHKRNLSSREIVEDLHNELRKWSGRDSFTDDVCIICMEIDS